MNQLHHLHIFCLKSSEGCLRKLTRKVLDNPVERPHAFSNSCYAIVTIF